MYMLRNGDVSRATSIYHHATSVYINRTPNRGTRLTGQTGGDANISIPTGIAVVERGKGGGERCCARSALSPTILLRAATQTKPNVDFLLGSRGPGTNEGDLLLMPHLAEIHPIRSRTGL